MVNLLSFELTDGHLKIGASKVKQIYDFLEEIFFVKGLIWVPLAEFSH